MSGPQQSPQQGYQENLPGFVPKEEYLNIIKNTQVISADLLVFNDAGKVLLGKRTGEPAKDTWFVPGGRVRINESFPAAVRRIVVQELGIIIDNQTPEEHRPKPAGVYHQTYSNNFDNDDFGAHYITFAYTLTLINASNEIPKTDYQHSEFKWWSIEDLIASPDVHIYCKNYFHPTPWNKIQCS
tara:strand:+ start:951 stop:1502 length:552 start_codon:yes stop_codon:yes gene_type:complete